MFVDKEEENKEGQIASFRFAVVRNPPPFDSSTISMLEKREAFAVKLRNEKRKVILAAKRTKMGSKELGINSVTTTNPWNVKPSPH